MHRWCFWARSRRGEAKTNLTVSTNSISLENNASPALSVDLDVTNTGQKAGKEVVQLYLGLPSTDDVPQPPSQLKRFEKVSLNPGETRRVHFDLDARAMSYWNTKKHGWEILPGAYQVKVGSSSRDLPLQGTFQVD